MKTKSSGRQESSTGPTTKTKTVDNRVIHILEPIPQHHPALPRRWAVFYDAWHWSMDEEKLRSLLKDPEILEMETPTP